MDLSSYRYPTLELLENYVDKKIEVNKEELEANKNRIVETLSHYNISIEKIKATIGPTVTLFEIVPQAGVRISKIKNLEDDIALSLSALGIRIIAPIPVSYTHLRAHETVLDLVCRLLLEKKKQHQRYIISLFCTCIMSFK